ncbi:hypothetical protein [Erythrobacter litoralis]|uniref:Lipoprotein n=1 Tax=Erythrobacter litoralis (strain HTCC2594) TaxID=314225 RepID=Q2N7D6_ERYLH|nr:hypothetical protein [Erythrobacter litoralis]ABC64405.1 hypothetical protein ELI_11565 [Erythrobacter litoralis HTCC2594]
MRYPILFLPCLTFAACADPEIAATPAQSEHDLFFAALASHCGEAYAGELVSTDEADADFRGADMVMHVRECDESEIRVPFHVQRADGSWDRSRTWVFTRTDGGLRLKHDHRHDDGEPDAVTMYGGDTVDAGTARSQGFPVDAESIALFEREGLDASVTNVWTVEVDPAGSEDAEFAYQLQRTVAGGAPADRFFRVAFDLTRPVEPPPTPWGAAPPS